MLASSVHVSPGVGLAQLWGQYESKRHEPLPELCDFVGTDRLLADGKLRCFEACNILIARYSWVVLQSARIHDR